MTKREALPQNRPFFLADIHRLPYKRIMNHFLMPFLTVAVFTTVTAIASDAPPTPATKTVSSVSPATADKVALTAEQFVTQTLALLQTTQETLAKVKDTESADKEAKALTSLLADIRQLVARADKLDSEEQEKLFESLQSLEAEFEKRVAGLIDLCTKEGTRISEARYYGSTALKDILTTSEEFQSFIPSEDHVNLHNVSDDEEDADDIEQP